MRGHGRSPQEHEIRTLVDSGHEKSYGHFEFVLIAPVVIDGSDRYVFRSVETVFQIVVPDDRLSNERNHPEAIAVSSIGILLPLLWHNAYRVPKSKLDRRHSSFALRDSLEQRFL